MLVDDCLVDGAGSMFSCYLIEHGNQDMVFCSCSICGKQEAYQVDKDRVFKYLEGHREPYLCKNFRDIMFQLMNFRSNCFRYCGGGHNFVVNCLVERKNRKSTYCGCIANDDDIAFETRFHSNDIWKLHDNRTFYFFEPDRRPTRPGRCEHNPCDDIDDVSYFISPPRQRQKRHSSLRNDTEELKDAEGNDYSTISSHSTGGSSPSKINSTTLTEDDMNDDKNQSMSISKTTLAFSNKTDEFTTDPTLSVPIGFTFPPPMQFDSNRDRMKKIIYNFEILNSAEFSQFTTKMVFSTDIPSPTNFIHQKYTENTKPTNNFQATSDSRDTNAIFNSSSQPEKVASFTTRQPYKESGTISELDQSTIINTIPTTSDGYDSTVSSSSDITSVFNEKSTGINQNSDSGNSKDQKLLNNSFNAHDTNEFSASFFDLKNSSVSDAINISTEHVYLSPETNLVVNDSSLNVSHLEDQIDDQSIKTTEGDCINDQKEFNLFSLPFTPEILLYSMFLAFIFIYFLIYVIKKLTLSIRSRSSRNDKTKIFFY